MSLQQDATMTRNMNMTQIVRVVDALHIISVIIRLNLGIIILLVDGVIYYIALTVAIQQAIRHILVMGVQYVRNTAKTQKCIRTHSQTVLVHASIIV